MQQYTIIHTTCHTQWGGLEKRILNESLWMRDRGHNITIIAPHNTPLITKAKAHNLKVYGLQFTWSSFFTVTRSLKIIFKTDKPDIVNTHGNEDSKIVLLTAKQTEIPLKILSRHISAPVKNSWYNEILYRRLCHQIFTTSHFTKKQLQETFQLENDKVSSMPSGIIPPESLLEKEEAKYRVQSELNIDQSLEGLIGFVGRVSDDKGIPVLFEACAHIKDAIAGYHLVIVGGGDNEYIDYLKKLACNYGMRSWVHFVGLKENVWDYYRAFDMCILPSQEFNERPFEGVPQTLLESMHCSCPVVASNTGGIRDIVLPGKTGRLFEYDQPEMLGQAIREVINNPATTKSYVENAKKMVDQQYTMGVMGQKISDIYDRYFKNRC